MTDHITIGPAEGTWVIRAGGAIVAETTAALELVEGGMTPVIYFPRGDVAMALMEPSTTRSNCPWKGEAAYFSVIVPSGKIADAAWSYETPLPGSEAIAGYLAFYPTRVTIEQV
jgi:uncharacterized protein (DUF427 family)